jgi:hypothetical protein
MRDDYLTGVQRAIRPGPGRYVAAANDARTRSQISMRACAALSAKRCPARQRDYNHCVLK